MPKVKEKAPTTPVTDEVPGPGPKASKELVSKFQAFLVSLDTLSNATQSASYAANQYFSALYPNSGLPEPSFFGFNRAAVNSAVAGAVSQGGADDADEEGNPAKRRKRSKSTIPKDPNAPKKPLTAYFAFARKTRPDVAAALPGASNKEITDELAARWGAMKDTGEQQSFRDQYALDMKTYIKTLAQYKAKLSGVPLDILPDAIVAATAAVVEEEEDEEPEPAPPKPTTPKSTGKGRKTGESATRSGRKGKEKEKSATKKSKRTSAKESKEVTPPPSAGEEEQPAPAAKSPRKRKRKD